MKALGTSSTSVFSKAEPCPSGDRTRFGHTLCLATLQSPRVQGGGVVDERAGQDRSTAREAEERCVHTPLLVLSCCCGCQLGAWAPGQEAGRKKETGDLSLPMPWHSSSFSSSSFLHPSLTSEFQDCPRVVLESTLEPRSDTEAGKGLATNSGCGRESSRHILGHPTQKVHSRVSLSTKTLGPVIPLSNVYYCETKTFVNSI